MNDTLDWLDGHALALDEGDVAAGQALLGRLGRSGLLRVGVPAAQGGTGGSLGDAVDAIAQVARHSLTAAFVCWGQRAFIEYLLQSPNAALRERALPGLLGGEEAGATGLSNAMKFLSGLEQLGVRAFGAGPWTLQGRVPWASNLGTRFCVALAVARDDGAPPFVVAVPADRAGVARSADLDLIALRGSQTAALTLADVPIDDADVIHPVAREFLPRARPAFLGLQCGLSIGLAEAALGAAREHLGPARAVLGTPLTDAEAALAAHRAELLQGLAEGRFLADAPALFRLRIALAQDVQQALQLELLASGGRAYHRDQPLGFARRWREAAFIPIVTPSLSQLQGELAKLAA
ncbi:acyl-CoA dehydrogenase family protein [Roseateles cellulosilyticus]|uniref:Acyl-CoA dehydrogenase family protein n=1 Tax=Pelomonas cellulosilytica TaxID=2906762 RepID=A0ABS8XMH4_9BURK|nr:acyl-CoA dehydrogenase family protein [Pelomonas sp. P8]MCE4553976.1 acyl-CoA dehydrogenase family protein [Pelomonas sp. P8]